MSITNDNDNLQLTLRAIPMKSLPYYNVTCAHLVEEYSTNSFIINKDGAI